MKMALCYYLWLLALFSSLATPGFLLGARRLAHGNTLSPENFDVLGIRLGDSSVADVERILGSATFTQGRNVEEATRCYASLGRDGTVLEINSWLENVVEFRFYRGSPQSVKHCGKSGLVSPELATASGLRLGMGRNEVIALLGTASRNQANRITYECSYYRSPTPEEIKVFKVAHNAPPVSINVYEKIDLRLRREIVTRVVVSLGKDW